MREKARTPRSAGTRALPGVAGAGQTPYIGCSSCASRFPFSPTGGNPDRGTRSQNGGNTVAAQITIDDGRIRLGLVTQ